VRSKKNKIIILVIFLLVVVGSITIVAKHTFSKDTKINYVLKTESYLYLPKAAQNYVKSVFEETGEVVLTEKNKEVNKPYLNPLYVEYLNMSDEEKKTMGEIPIPLVVDYYQTDYATNVDLPSSYDLRNVDGKNYVTPVRDQGDLGLCWAFASAGVAESHLLTKNNNTYSGVQDLFSERQIDYATSINGIKDYKSEYVSFIDRNLGDGGNFYISTIAMANGISLYRYNSFKEYNDTDMSKMELSDVLNYNKSLYEVNSTINMPLLNLRESTSVLTEEETNIRNSYLNQVKENIMNNGAAYVGTYMNSYCSYYDEKTNNLVLDVYNCPSSGGHAMQIIGWDDNFEYAYCADTTQHDSNIENCNSVVSGKGVWILKNSWGEEDQYPYLTYDSYGSDVHFIDDLNGNFFKDWNNNYILGNNNIYTGKVKYELMDTNIRGTEQLKKIKFMTDSSNTKYTINVKDLNGKDIEVYMNVKLPGLVTFDFSAFDIYINKDSEISISTDGYFADKVSVFTSNVDTQKYIDLEKYENMKIDDYKIRLYSTTKNIPSGAKLQYKIYNNLNQDLSSKITVSNNVVAENNINTLITFANDFSEGKYKIDVIYNSKVISSANVEFLKMEGLGTKTSPYIIKTANQLNQIRNDLDAYYELGNDIDLSVDTRSGGRLSSESSVCPQGFGWQSIKDFNGSLDGKGYSIKGLYQNNYITCNEGGELWIEWSNLGNGLFASAYGDVTIKNLVLEDFEMNCQGGNCGVLLSSYYSPLGNTNVEYTATFENIILRNSKISGVYNTRNISSLNYSYGGGLFGSIASDDLGKVNISNIHLDFTIIPKELRENAYLISHLQAGAATIKNIYLGTHIDGKYSDGSGDSVLINYVYKDSDISISNVLSTVTGSNVSGILFNSAKNIVLDNANVLNIENRSLCDYGCNNITNVNIYDKNTELVKLTDKNNYSTWNNFDNNWVMETVDGIKRIPVLKFVDFEYTKISDITLKQKLNEHKSIYDYVYPSIDAAKRISYKSNDENIIKIDENGILIPQSTGNTTIHIESYYDGYIKDVPISVEYKPHYTIHFDANDTEDYYREIIGTMESIEVEAGKSFMLPANQFVQEYYEFKEWNTKPDGTGISYSDLSEIPAMNDKDEITLYVQWWGKERVVTFDASGGTVNPSRKEVRIREPYGDLPIPSRKGYGFINWTTSSNSLAVDAFDIFRSEVLIARWKENAYSIVYDANGGTYKTESDLYMVSESLAITYAINGTAKKISKNIYQKPGYKFSHWNTKADGSGISYNEEKEIALSNVENDRLNLYAIWEKTSFKLTYNSNIGDSSETDTKLCDVNTEISVSSNEFVREGYTFVGWNTLKDGTGISYKVGDKITMDKDLTLYAQWMINQYNVKFDANNGIGVMNNQIFTHDVSQKLSENIFTREGYTFFGWNTKSDGSGDSYTDEQEIAITSDMTLYAQWREATTYEINKYSVDETNKYIDLIEVSTTVEDFKTNITLGEGYTVNVDSKEINGKKVMYTGGKTKIYYGDTLYMEYTNIVRGDANGDGVMDIFDYIRIMKDIMEETFLSGIYKIGADVTKDNMVDIFDYIRIMKKIMEEN